MLRSILYILKIPTLIVAFSCIFLSVYAFAEDGKIALKNDEWTINIYPNSLQVMAELKGKDYIIISAPQDNLGAVENLKQSEESEVNWELAEETLTISFQLDGDTLHAHFQSKVAGLFTWPIISNESSIRGYILPLFEGSYVPSDDSRWLTFLVERSPMNTTEGLSKSQAEKLVRAFQAKHGKVLGGYNPDADYGVFKARDIEGALSFVRDKECRPYVVLPSGFSKRLRMSDNCGTLSYRIFQRSIGKSSMRN